MSPTLCFLPAVASDHDGDYDDKDNGDDDDDDDDKDDDNNGCVGDDDDEGDDSMSEPQLSSAYHYIMMKTISVKFYNFRLFTKK